jgi:hypothetical protein
MLQVVAWGKMIIEYSADRGLAQGIEDTFDGKHGCCMCKKIREEHGKKQQQENSLRQTEQLIKIYAPNNWSVVFTGQQPKTGSEVYFASPHLLRAQWGVSPEAPPPRRV